MIDGRVTWWTFELFKFIIFAHFCIAKLHYPVLIITIIIVIILVKT